MDNLFIKEFQQQQRIRGMSERTVDGYTDNIILFMRHFKGMLPTELTISDIHGYVLHLKEVKKQSHSYINQQIASVKFFCLHVLRKDWDFAQIPYLRLPHRLPVVVSREEVVRILNVATNLKHKAIIATLYGTGIRNNELTWLKTSDILSTDMVIQITHGKGARERLVPLAQPLLDLLRRYWRDHPGDKHHWLFPGDSPTERMKGDTVSAIYRRCKEKAAARRDSSAHSLRHSFATHCLENGVDIRVIQHVVGHSDIAVTCRYAHVAKMTIAKIPSPLAALRGANLH